MQWIRDGVNILLHEIRSNFVVLVDANDFTDFCMKSALGRSDGNAYEAILESEPGPGYDHLKWLIADGVCSYTGTISTL